jgi:Tfp pilus assembly protein PilN
MSNFLKDFYKDKQSVGIEIIFQPDNTKVYNLILLKQEKGILFIESKEQITSLEDLKASIPTNVPVSLVLTGKGILHKTISINEKDTEITLLQKVLPNAQVDDFFIQKIAFNDELIISLIRKDQFELVLNEFSTISNQIITVSSGPFIAGCLLPLLPEKEEQITIDFLNYRLEYQNQLFSSYDLVAEKTDKEYDFSGNKVNSSLMLAFSAALSVFLPNQTEIKNNIQAVTFNNEEFYQKKIFKVRLGFALGILFLLMLINFLFFSTFFSKKNTLSEKVNLVQSQLQQHDTLMKEVEQKKSFLSEAGLLEASRISYYADQIAKDLSPSITLTELNINPIAKTVTPDGDILNATNKLIKITGQCTQTTILNEWIKLLEKKTWVKNVHMVNYTQLKSSEPGEFILEIYLP